MPLAFDPSFATVVFGHFAYKNTYEIKQILKPRRKNLKAMTAGDLAQLSHAPPSETPTLPRFLRFLPTSNSVASPPFSPSALVSFRRSDSHLLSRLSGAGSSE